jgi:hypothetical protein
MHILFHHRRAGDRVEQVHVLGMAEAFRATDLAARTCVIGRFLLERMVRKCIALYRKVHSPEGGSGREGQPREPSETRA